MMKKGIVAFGLCLVMIAGVQAQTAITVENHSFEDPGNGKIRGWDQADGATYVTGGAPAEVPGWESDGTISDSGVETGYTPTDGDYTAYLMGSDPSVYQLMDHVILPGQEFELIVDSRITGGGPELTMSLYYDDGGARNTVSSSVVTTLTTTYAEFTLTFAADSAPAAIGKKLGIEFDNTSGGWMGLDMVRLNVEGGGPQAWDPDPPDDPGLVLPEVPTNKTMSWKTGEDPNDGNYGAGPEPSIKGHYIYLTTIANKAALEAIPPGVTTDPNIYRGYQLVGSETYTPGVYDAVTNPGGLDSDKVNCWRIDERSEYGGGQEPNIWKGNIWTFQTTKLLPLIDEQPQDTAAFTGDPAEISISVTSATQETYEWKKVNPAGEDPNVGTNSDTLSFASVQADPDEGQYYCVVTNNAGSVTSTSAWLDVKRLVGRWQLNNNLTDSAGGRTGVIDPGAGYGGTPPADPNFNEDGIEDLIGGNGQSYEFYDDVTEIIKIPGTDTDQFNFHKRSGLTVSTWVKTTLTSHWGAPVSRQDKTGANKGWILNTSTPTYGDSGVMTIREAHQDVLGSTSIKDNEWHLLTGTYDPATGMAEIYIDGRLEAGWTDTSALSDVAVQIVLGAETTAGDVAFDGLVDDVRIYNYPLNGFEIALLYTDIRQSETRCPEPITIDYNNDCVQDILDLEIFLRTWLQCNQVRDCWSPDHPLD